MRERLRRIVRAVYARLPKLPVAVLWGWPDYEDSVLALEQALQRAPVRRVILLMTDPSAPPPEPLGPKTRRVRKDGPRGWLWFLVARYVLFTHRCFLRDFPSSVVSVNVWHGMPLKRIEALVEPGAGIRATWVLATGEMWAPIMEGCMGEGSRALVSGLPRNDRLLLDPGPVRAALDLAGRDDVDRIVVWLPTFRRSVRGYLTEDGAPTGSPFELDVDVVALEAFLAEHRTFLVVKPHPMTAFAGEQRGRNLLVLDSAALLAKGLSLYRLLAASDVLVSDVSSVTVDYLLVDRPIVHAMADLDAYRETRGFTVDRIEDMFMGPVVTTTDELLGALAPLLRGEDPHAEQRRAVRDRCHAHVDGRATERVLDAIGLSPADAG